MLARYIFLLLCVFLRSCGLDINNGQMLNGHYTLLYAPFPFCGTFVAAVIQTVEAVKKD